MHQGVTICRGVAATEAGKCKRKLQASRLSNGSDMEVPFSCLAPPIPPV